MSPTIREVIEERIKVLKNTQVTEKESISIAFVISGLEHTLKEILTIEEAYQKRIEELEERLKQSEAAARVYDLLMEMPKGFTLYNHKLYKGDWYAQLDEHDEDFDIDDIVISGGKTPQDALEKLKEKLNLQNGLHQTRDGTKIKISEMTTRHLVNTINYFKIPNGSRYHKELEKRNITNK